MSATTTAADVLLEARRYLQSGQRDERNQLAAPYTAGQSTLTFTFDMRGITQGCTISIGLNTFYVWSMDSSSKTAQVTGGQDGSVDADCDQGDLVLVRPRHTDSDLLRMLNDELQDLSAPANGIYRMLALSFAITGATVGYDLTGTDNVLGIYEVRVADPAAVAYGDRMRLRPHEYRLESSDATTSSGYRLMLYGAVRAGATATVLYRAALAPVTSLATVMTSTGLAPTATDLPAMGTALRAVVGREIRRNDTASQGDTRRAEEVPAGAQAASWRGLAAMRATRLQSEASRLQSQYPVLM